LFSRPSINCRIATGCEPAGAKLEASWNSVTVLRISGCDIKRDRVVTGKWGRMEGYGMFFSQYGDKGIQGKKEWSESIPIYPC